MFPELKVTTSNFIFCSKNSSHLMSEMQIKAANRHILEAGTCKCLTSLLNKRLKRLIDYQSSWHLLF